MSILFTSDLHFLHSRIIEYTKRPFKNVNEMNEAIISRWNDVVTKDDFVYILGDVGLGNGKQVDELVSRLQGKKFLIIGNHDRKNMHRQSFVDNFIWARDMFELKVQDKDAQMGHQRIVLCHYAMLTWNHQHHSSWQLFGHSHNSLPDNPNSLSIDVGLDAHDYRPISYEQVKALMSKKTWKKVDHHNQEDR